MALNRVNSPPASVLDASFVIALCAKEAGKFDKAESELQHRLRLGSLFYAPGVLVSEALFVLCRQLSDGLLTPQHHLTAIETLDNYLVSILPPPNGDKALMRRAEEIRSGYGCSRSADGLYIALAEELSATMSTSLLTFDRDLPSQAARNAPSVMVRLLS